MTRNETLLEGRTEALRLESEQRKRSRWGYQSDQESEVVKEEQEEVSARRGHRGQDALPAIAGATTSEPSLEPADRRDYEDPVKNVTQDPDNLVRLCSTSDMIERDAPHG